MKLGMEVGLGPTHIVFYGDPALPRKGAQQPPLFGPCIVANGWMDQDATWYGGSSPTRMDTAAPSFWPMYVVVKRLDGSRCHLVWR